MSYKVGTEVLVKGYISEELDHDNEYYVEFRGSGEALYIGKDMILGRVHEYERKVKYMVGDVLSSIMRPTKLVVLSNETSDGFITTFRDGSGSNRTIRDLDRYFKHTGINIKEELDSLFDALDKVESDE